MKPGAVRAMIGLMDADIYGPSVPIMFGLQTVDPRTTPFPLEKHGIKLMSMGFMVDPTQPDAVEYASAARERGMGLAVASSSSRAWVEGHLDRLGIRSWFDHVLCSFGKLVQFCLKPIFRNLRQRFIHIMKYRPI